jgi:hypothetical protein
MKAIARELNARNIPAYFGGCWRGTEVRRLIERMAVTSPVKPRI